MAINLETHKFVVPQRKVLKPTDIVLWEKSQGYQDLIGFLMTMNESVRGRKNGPLCTSGDPCFGIINVLNIVSSWIDDIPLQELPQRFGNKAFKQFYDKLRENAEPLLKENLDEKFHPAVPEISVYLIEGFGNSIRIDYGTGHEMSFIMFLCCLYQIGVLSNPSNAKMTVDNIFKSYLDVARKLQSTYKMEPAGSQGVWSLDDYQFIPFYWGSSQFIMNDKVTPDMFTNEKFVEENYSSYMFLESVKYILQVKTGPFAEHSNQLWNISGVPSWTKVNQGLLKMYKAEVLKKFPIIQHVLFGSLIRIEPAPDGAMAAPASGSLFKGLSASAPMRPPSIQRPSPKPDCPAPKVPSLPTGPS